MLNNQSRSPRQLSAIAVFTGSASGEDSLYAEAAIRFARFVAHRGTQIVYGGGSVGLMGVVAEAAMGAGGVVTGVIPEQLLRAEAGNTKISTLEVVPDMHARKARMAELADGFVALPGGIGTLEEVFEVLTWQRLKFHNKPVAFFNAGNFWGPLLAAIEHMAAAGFVPIDFRSTIIVADDPAELLRLMESWQPEIAANDSHRS